jgi:chromosomal replication initiation ATPase DnaA
MSAINQLQGNNLEMNEAIGFTELQIVVEKVVGKIGVRSTIALLNGCVGSVKEEKMPSAQRHLLPSIILQKVKEVYRMDEKEIYCGKSHEAADARKICYHICTKYTSLSRPKVGLLFGGASKRKVQDSISKTDELLFFSKQNKVFCSNYSEVEKVVIEFLTAE